MGIFSNIGNFGRKVSDLNEQRKEKQFDKLKDKALKADMETKKLQEEQKLRNKIKKRDQLKSKLRDDKKKNFEQRLNKFSFEGDKKRKSSFDLGSGFKF